MGAGRTQDALNGAVSRKPIGLPAPARGNRGERPVSPSGRDAFRLGVLVPMRGSGGLWGPSCVSSAKTALAELNRGDGIGGREAEMVLVDAAVEAGDDLLWTVNDMIESGEISAIVGMHISAVRQNLVKVVSGRIPYVYTPLYEGGERSPGVYTIGETPSDQLGPAIADLARRHKVSRWALIGNDYVWPRSSNQFARKRIREIGGQVVLDRYVPIGAGCGQGLIDALVDSKADVLLLSLVGQDAVDFNRVFGALDLDRRIIRLSCAIEENTLLASGAENTKRLYVASSYFSVVDTQANQAFKEVYRSHHGYGAPTLNHLGQSLYEGVHFLSQLMSRREKRRQAGIRYRSARDVTYYDNGHKKMQTYLARADGMAFDIVEAFPARLT